MGAAEFLRGKLLSCFRGFPAACGSSAGCPEPGILQPQPVRQHVAPCVITMVFTTFHPSLSCVYNHSHYSRVTEQKHLMQIRDARVS